MRIMGMKSSHLAALVVFRMFFREIFVFAVFALTVAA